MKILMISTDRALLGENVSTGDAVKRHIDYGQAVDKLDIIVFSQKGYKPRELSDNVFCYPTNSRNRFFYIKNTMEIAQKLLEENEYNLIVCQDPFLAGLVGIKIKKRYNIKLLVHFHGDFWKNRYWLQENYLRFGLLMISRIVVQKADFIKVVSEGIKNKLLQAGVDENKIRVISTPIDLEKFKIPDNQIADSIRKEFDGKKIILWAGKMRQEKNLVFLLKCFKKISASYIDVVLLLVGDGRDFDKITKVRLELGLKDRVKMIGHLNYNKLIDYFHASYIVVLPSRHESFGKVLVEAGMAGKPVVASRTTGAREIVQDGKTGFLVDINDKNGFIRKVLKLLGNDELAGQMGKRAYDEIIKKFDYKKNVKAIIRLWEEIVL
ncbi:MAG: glycosyltransferase family 4 protein [Patescibacteria group bacterium]